MTQPPNNSDQQLSPEEVSEAISDGRYVAIRHLEDATGPARPGEMSVPLALQRELVSNADAMVRSALDEFHRDGYPHNAGEASSSIQDLAAHPWTTISMEERGPLLDHLNSFIAPGQPHLRELIKYPTAGYSSEAMVGIAAEEFTTPERVALQQADAPTELTAEDLQRRVDPYIPRVPSVERDREEAVDIDKLQAVWIQATVEGRTLLEHGHADVVRQKIEALDQTLREYLDGEVPPGSPEHIDGVLPDAVARLALPHDSNGPDPQAVLTEYRNQGHYLPDFTNGAMQEATGIIAVTPAQISNALEAQTKPSPELQDVAAARGDVRRAIRSLNDGANAARDHLFQANKLLTAVVERLRPEPTDDMTQAHESVKEASKSVKHVADAAAQLEAGITVYTTPECPGCFATKRALDKAELPYNEIDLSTRPDLVAQFKQQGFAQAPIVEAGGETWSGFRPDKMKGLTSDYQQRTRNDRPGPDTGHGR